MTPLTTDQLQQLLNEYQALKQILLQETDILRENDPDKLITINEQKSQHLNRLAGLEVQLQSSIPTQKSTSLAESIEKHLSQSDSQDKQQLQQLWNSIKEVVAACQYQNAVNGRVVHSALNMTQETLKVLRQGGDQSMVYDEQGKID